MFLGEVRVTLKGLQKQATSTTTAWYAWRLYHFVKIMDSHNKLYKLHYFIMHRYFLQPRAAKHRPSKISSNSTPPGTLPGLGSLRLKIHYVADHVFPSEMYDRLRSLLLQSINVQPITSSAVYILGEIVASKMEAAQPLVRVLVHHGQLVSVMRALASHEISKLT